MAHERITITMDKHLLGQIDILVKKNGLRNRSNAINYFVKSALPQTELNFAVVCVGGRGVEKSSGYIIKVMKCLLVEGIDQFMIIYGHYGQSIKSILEAQHQFEDKLQFSFTDLGSGGGLKQIYDQLPNQFVLVNIQEKIDLNWDNLQKYHQKYAAAVTMQISGHYRGVAIVNKTFVDQIANQFSIIEDDILPKLTSETDIIYLP
ncbi:MAG: hypothetical protein WC773_00860 [Patescibacteria group bacterium]|jgi:metal-responsive CopG/Arc/MetJ family transcriptional regulator